MLLFLIESVTIFQLELQLELNKLLVMNFGYEVVFDTGLKHKICFYS